MRLKDKVALVTGSGYGGIGAAICKRFAEEGATVVASNIDLESVQKVASEISAGGGVIVAKHQDVTVVERWTDLVDDIIAEYGKLDILVNNAGIASPATVEEETLEGWQRTQLVNQDAVFLGTKEAIRVMKEKGGSIINVSSIEGIIGEPLAPAYNASKGGVRIFTKSAALHCSSQNYPIRINSLHPGYVVTPLVQGAMQGLGEEAAEAFGNRILSSIPMQRMGEAVEIANGALFLASDESSYMTGSELVIDGGYTAR